MRSYRFYKASDGKVHSPSEFSRCVTYELTVKTLATALSMEGVVSMDRPASIQKVKNRQKMTGGFRKITGQQVFCPLLTVIEPLKRRGLSIIDPIKKGFEVNWTL